MAPRRNRPTPEQRNSGAWLGGNRGTVQSTGSGRSFQSSARMNSQTFNRASAPSKGFDPNGSNFTNQTRFDLYGNPIYPEPRSIRSLPPQIAGYTDDFSTRGEIASTKDQKISPYSYPISDFLYEVDTVQINPAYKTAFNNVGNDPDSAEYVSNYKGAVPVYRMQKLQNIAQGLKQFAQASSTYFDKKFEILPHPNMQPTTITPDSRTLQLNVGGFEDPRSHRYVAAGHANIGLKRGQKRSSKGTWEPSGPYIGNMGMNTNLNDRFTNTPKSNAATIQHEFGHVLGILHPKGYDTGGSKNSRMSYAAESYGHGPKLLPSDINMYQEIYKREDIKRKAKNAYKGVAKKRK